VVLKILNNSKNINLNFLNEIANNKSVDNANNIVTCCGISQNPTTQDYIMVMEYMKEGNLRDYLKNNASKLSWEDKIYKLYSIANGLKYIHDRGLTHRDFHPGNILNDSNVSYITDLGLSRPVQFQKESEVYGILTYIAPEVLDEKPYTQASDIYSFGIVAYELLANTYPYPDLKNLYPELENKSDREQQFTVDVCRGLRPNIDEVPIPQLLKDLVKQC